MTKYLRNSDLITASLDEDLVMLDIEQGKYFSLNPVASSIWEYLKTPGSAEEITVFLEQEYDVSTEQCVLETAKFLKEMLELGLVKTV